MKAGVLTAALTLSVGAAFSQFNDKGYYLKRFSNEDEAIDDHRRMLDVIGIAPINYSKGNNPIALNYYKLSSGKVIASVVFTSSDNYDVLFMEVNDESLINNAQIIDP